MRASRLLTGTKPDYLSAVGNAALLDQPLHGLLVSRDCPGCVLLDTMGLVPQWVRDQRVILSGFHSPLEQQVLRSVLRRNGCVVKILARGMRAYRPPEAERDPLANGNMLVLTAHPKRVRRTTRETALERNRLVLALAADRSALALPSGIQAEVNLSANHLRDQIKALLKYFGIDQTVLSIYLRQDRDADA